MLSVFRRGLMPGTDSKPEVQLPDASHAGRDHSGNI
jgi:hypothetical protein